MKVTKQQEKEIMQVYNAYWDNYLQGDVEAMKLLLDDEYTQVGSAEGEVFLNKKDAVQFLYDTIDQVAGKLEMRNRSTIPEQQGELILIHERCDLYALADGGWIYYSKFRASTLLKEKKQEWKITHQHSSFPDARAEDGENIAINKIAAENLQLREAVKRRTVELEQKNRDLEIETALERVRARTMAMQHSDELAETSFLLDSQVRALGIKTRGCGFNIYGVNESMEWFSSELGTMPTYKTPREHFFLTYYEAGQRGETLLLQEFAGEECVAHYDYLCSLPGTGEGLRQFKASGGSFPSHQIDHVAYFNYGYLLFITLESVPEAHDIFKRFAKVFEQTYTRFLDLQKAEAQTREAQIEAALERVRSCTMAMHKSEELRDVIEAVYKQLVDLQLPVEHAGFILDYKEEHDMHIWFASKQVTPSEIKIPYFDSPHWNSFQEAKAEGKSFFANKLNFEEKNKFYKDLFKWIPPLPDEAIKSIFSRPGLIISTFLLENVGLYIENYSQTPFTDEENTLLMRFGKVFEQAYTRFLDLQKAEAQAKEGQIQLALERVRARTMAMQKSEELPKAANLLFQQVQSLGMPAWSAGYCIWDDNKQGITLWMSSEGLMQPSFTAPLTKDPSFIHMRDAYEKGQTFHVEEVGGKALVEHYKYMRTLPVVGDVLDSIIEAGHPLPTFQIFHCVYFSQGFLLFITYESVPEAHEIFKRFGNVFDQTYTRFLDLQKAETQTREAQIELGLERVRARAMAMQKSGELSELVDTVFKELTKLDFALNWCIINIIDELSLTNMVWAANPETNKPPESYLMKFEDYPFHHSMLKGYQERKTKHVYVIEGKEKTTYDNYLFNETEWRKVPKAAQDASRAMKRYVATFSFSNFGGLQTVGEENMSEENLDILSRFGKVFDLTYTRFNDLQKAEAQAKEAQIEASLERVRSKTMAMHNSVDVGETVATLFDELVKLGVHTNRCGILINSEASMHAEVWTAKSNPAGKANLIIGQLDLTMHTLLAGIYQAWKSKEPVFIYPMIGDDLIAYYQAINNTKYYPTLFDLDALPSKEFHTDFYFAEGSIFSFTPELLTEEASNIFKRFAGVFGQTYTRFLDLQKAEAQAREAQIETCLERVRSRSLAMHHTSELQEVIHTVHKELLNLNIAISGGSFITINNDITTTLRCWGSGGTADTSEEVILPVYEKPFCTNLINEIKKGPGFFTEEFTKEEKIEFFTFLFKHEPWSKLDAKQQQETLSSPGGYTRSCAVSMHTSIFIINHFGKIFSEDENEILKRFAKVFEQAYTRFLDLQKAEAQARESQIETALERVRSRTLAMQKSDELAETATEVFRQLIYLGIEPNRLYIGIVKAETSDMEMWATDEDGTHVGKKFMFNKNENASVKKLFDGWKAKEKSVVVDMQGKELEDYFHYLNNVMHIPFKGGLTQKRRVQSVAYFSKGFIGMASPDGQGDETIQLLERFAAVFNLTFTRFNDLKIAEAHALQAEQDLIAITVAKKKAEEALTVLQTTQKQLIQSEKMASLGELTAGIAHEIQNPLNFVNNFSDLSSELLDEMMEEMVKGNFDEVKEILNDVKQNLEKINHHGKRADAIVKGMLQHSRTSSGVKEPTDINALADEYLRLAYHGLRAKDKSFNASLKTDFDESIGRINIIPQDIGRVILNLITNAFFVVNEKSRQGITGYEPTVEVSTKKVKDKVEVKVKDNGNGIPQKILDKIFQPFFTTKPTGQGTGLGLSLSYDIVKAHGGELKVETKVDEGNSDNFGKGEGSEFTIYLPIS